MIDWIIVVTLTGAFFGYLFYKMYTDESNT